MPDRAEARLPRPKSIARALAISSTAAAALLSSTTAVDEAEANSSLDLTERRVVREVNRVRGGHGLRAFRRNRALSRSADFHSRDMVRGNFFAHGSSNGTSFEGRVRRYTRAARIGENLARVPGRGRHQGVAQQVVGMWMGSASHRAALLTPDFAQIGVARRTGRIGGVKATVFTADLATAR